MKKCYTCQQEKLNTEFGINKFQNDNLQTSCKSCRKEIRKKWYQKRKKSHIDAVKNRITRRKDELMKIVISYLREHPCVDCSESDPIVLEFDHTQGNKVSNISSLVSSCTNNDTLLLEIKKCEVRCANCHRKRTARYFNHLKFRLCSSEERAPHS